ncbi:hypothetical protein NDU88_008156 [Pleurodeles waltl]|uniref:Uncharacterized protein n=1 Tax=Pleurodeles waltl TaxID=8319 RepID=A0AAV7NZZ6_PLEWA|nr:hypothetical protein NDU88_008156 [Pleurodeles waltl]
MAVHGASVGPIGRGARGAEERHCWGRHVPGTADARDALRLPCADPATCGGPSLCTGTWTELQNGPSTAVEGCHEERPTDRRYASSRTALH